MMMKLEQVLERFFESDDFADAVTRSTKASRSGSGYSVELFEGGHWRVLWDNEIGNLYSSPGAIISVPPLDDDDYQECVVENGMDEDEWFILGFENERDEIADQMRQALSVKVEC